MVFSLSALWWRRIRGLWKLPDGRDWLRGKQGLVLMGGAMLSKSLIQFSVDGQGCVPSLLFDLRPWTAACQASLSLTNSQNLLKLMSIMSVIQSAISSSVIPFFSCLQSFPASGSFPMSQFFTSGGQSIRVSASASLLAMNIQGWFPLRWTDWISLLFKGR